MKKITIAKKIEAFLKKYDCLADTRIYFNGIAWDYDSDSNKKILDNINASNYFEYANDDTISMSFEGALYEHLNGTYGYAIKESFDKLLKKEGYYYEMGNAWNLALYPID